jgi:hypothetical protein
MPLTRLNFLDVYGHYAQVLGKVGGVISKLSSYGGGGKGGLI